MPGCSGINFEDTASPLKVANVALFGTLAERLEGHVLPVHKAVQIMSAIRARSVAPTSKMRCVPCACACGCAFELTVVCVCLRLCGGACVSAYEPGCSGSLDIGGVVSIPVWTYGKTAEAKLPTMKKQSAAATPDGNGDVGVDRQYRSAADLTKEVPPDDRVKSYRYGKELFPVNPRDEALMGYESERQLAVLCFTAAARIPRECPPPPARPSARPISPRTAAVQGTTSCPVLMSWCRSRALMRVRVCVVLCCVVVVCL